MSDPTHAPTRVELSADQVRRRCDPSSLPREASADLTPISGLIGQQRAVDALAFGLGIEDRGFNVFVAGLHGTGKTTAVRAFLEEAARGRPVPDDWCYVHNFRDPSRPRALRLPPGQGRRLRDDVARLIQAARREVPRAFESEEFIARREAIVGELSRRREQRLAQLSTHAQAAGFLLQVTPMGVALVPLMGNQPLTDEQLAQMPPNMRAIVDRNRELLEGEVRAFLKDMRAAERETRERLEAQDREVALHAVGGLVDDLVDDYADQEAVSAYLEEIREGILADIALFRGHPLPQDGNQKRPAAATDPEHALHERSFRRYEVNVIVDNGDRSGAPVILESNPTHPNLIGRVEREALFGALLTDFTLISPGALHEANGGYLVLRVEDVLRAPLAWDSLKRALREDAVTIEDPSEMLGITSTRGLRPDPIPLDLKVFLLGDPVHYLLLHELDPDFRELFKVRADFETAMERTPTSETAYAALISACAARSGQPMEPAAVAILIEESSRLAADQRKLSVRFGQVLDLVREAGYWSRAAGEATIAVSHVRKAVEQRLYRSSLIRERLREMIERGILLLRPSGMAVGQIHGLAVVAAGDLAFGRPSRITATVGAGRDGVLDLERQAELGGRIHSKGILILVGYLTDTYARDKPLALSARLVFEQSYEEVEGDSASLAELVALLSRLADVPLNQAIAVTGSVNQRGEVQAVGGVNEKVEGFFDACQALGLAGDQGVIVPDANRQHLMLREDVVEAVRAGRFHVYPARTVDEALEILTGQPAGPRRSDGMLPADGIHARVDAQLRALAETLREFGGPPSDNHDRRARDDAAVSARRRSPRRDSA